MTLELLLSIFSPIVLGYVAYNETDKRSNKKKYEAQLENIHSLNASIKVLESQYLDIERDLKRIESKLDSLYTHILATAPQRPYIKTLGED